MDSGRVGCETEKTADIRETGSLRFLDVGAVVLDTGLPVVTDLIVVGLLLSLSQLQVSIDVLLGQTKLVDV